MLLMGVNDISYEHVDASFLETAYEQAIAKAHQARKQILGVPILPFGHSVKDVGNNKQTAQVVNQWIRDHDKRQGAAEPSFDAVIDVEAAVKDASDPAWSLRSDLTCDHVHPNQAGYQAIAAAIPLALFTPVTAVPAARAGVVLLLALALALGQSFATIGSIRHKAFDAIADAEADVSGIFQVSTEQSLAEDSDGRNRASEVNQTAPEVVFSRGTSAASGGKGTAARSGSRGRSRDPRSRCASRRPSSTRHAWCGHH